MQATASENASQEETKELVERLRCYARFSYAMEPCFSRAFLQAADKIEELSRKKQGRWIKNDKGIYYCSECGCQRNPKINPSLSVYFGASSYCPNCGVKMDKN